MLFNSLAFAVFLPIVFILYWKVPPGYQWAVLLVSSCYFYMSWNAKYILLIGLTTFVSYECALLIERDRMHGRAYLTASLLVCLGTLFFFKYFNFAAGTLTAVMQALAIPVHPITLKVMLPVGISFYTFQTLSYVIDVYRGDTPAERHFGKYAAFITFFPQLVAGPIERSRNLLVQIKAEHRFDCGQATYGLKLMAWGFFKKIVIADNIAVYADRVFDDIRSYRGFSLILAALFFTIQIYCDFSGYSDIARGTAKLMGIELMENFKSPYFSASLHEFWSRWHISLSTWFRDYVYIPLGGNRVGRLRHYWNLLLTFLVSGLWHGANWTFVIWGGLHGCAQIAEHAAGLSKKRARNTFVWWLRVLLVFVFAVFAWVFFRAQSLGEAVYFFKNMFVGIGQPVQYLYNGISSRSPTGIGLPIQKLPQICISFLLLAAYDYASLKTDVVAWIGERPAVIRHGVYCLLILLIMLFHAIGEVAFVYFQF